MVFSIIKGSKERAELDTREAFNLWDVLKSDYDTVYRLKIYQNDTHDKDLGVLIKRILVLLEGNIKNMEKQLTSYSIPAPNRNRAAVNFPRNSQVISDEMVAADMFTFLQESIEHTMRGFRTSVTSDSLREYFKDLSVKKIELADKMVHYLKFKGWIETPPLFNHTPGEVNEKISTVEISNLFDHLTFRYDNINTSEIIRNFAYDGDFKTLLNMGIRTLSKQARILEKELEYFGVTLPKRPGKVTVFPDNTEILHDDHMFRTLIIGMYGATVLHIMPIKECTFNDRIRRIFINFLIGEIDMLDNMLKLGKVKGWFHKMPMYQT